MLPEDVRRLRTQWGLRPVYKMVDTCAAEFEAQTPYFYSSYEVEDEGDVGVGCWVLGVGDSTVSQPAPGTLSQPNTQHPTPNTQHPAKPKAIVIGSGPIRIGQGIEFDYCS